MVVATGRTAYVLASNRARAGQTKLAATHRNGIPRIVAFEKRSCAKIARVPGFVRDTLDVREIDLEQLGEDLGASVFAVDMCAADDDGTLCVLHAVIGRLMGSPGARYELVRDKLNRDYDMECEPDREP